MATSDRILTVMPQAATAERLSPISTAWSKRPSWHQAAIDFTVIAFTLSVTGYWEGSAFVRVQHAVAFVPLTVAGMITTVLAFCGAYGRDRTPLDITETEGLARGICCTFLLLSMLALTTLSVPSVPQIATGIFIIAFLALQREVARALDRERKMSHAVMSHSRNIVRLSHPEEDCWQSDNPDQHASGGALLKRSIDILLSAALLALLMPVFAVIAVLIRLDSGGPIFVRQLRVGKSGVRFCMWKFRSMQADVERYARSPVTDSDPRLTRLGRILRRISMDELPQLLNVLKGDMSLVGPRPEMAFIVERYNGYQRLRLKATPGITGLWQISPARAMPIHENVELDLFYIEHRNIFLDIAILLRTAAAVVRGVGAI